MDSVMRKKAMEFLEGVMTPEEVEQHIEEGREQQEQRIADAQIFFDVFATGRGAEMLELLKYKTIYLSTMNRSQAICDGDIPLNPGEFMAGREMQNALIRWIEAQIEIAQQKVED